MRKVILIFALLLSAMNMMAQAYKFETEEGKLNTGMRYITCDTKETIFLHSSSPDVSFGLYYDDKSKIPGIRFLLRKYAEDSFRNTFAIANKIRKLALAIPSNNKKEKVTINLHLSNGDILRGTNSGLISIVNVQRHMMEISDSVGFITAFTGTSLLMSSHIPKEIQTKENQQVICQQLRTYDIVKIDVDGVSFDVRGLRSAATFDAMFNALAQKTGKGHLYRYDSSSPSSSASSGPSASCKLGYVGVLSNGSILCRVDDLQIVEAKGKEASVYAFFEDANDDSKLCVFLKELSTLPYDVCNYKSLRVKGNVNDYSMLSQYRSRRFKVTIAVIVGGRFIYESNAKYITIYYKDGYWSSK